MKIRFKKGSISQGETVAVGDYKRVFPRDEQPFGVESDPYLATLEQTALRNHEHLEFCEQDAPVIAAVAEPAPVVEPSKPYTKSGK